MFDFKSEAVCWCSLLADVFPDFGDVGSIVADLTLASTLHHVLPLHHHARVHDDALLLHLPVVVVVVVRFRARARRVIIGRANPIVTEDTTVIREDRLTGLVLLTAS